MNKIQFNQRYTIEMTGTLSAKGRKEIAQIVKSDSDHNLTWADFLGFELKNKHGKLAKRLKNNLYKTYKTKLSPDAVTNIGNVAFNNTVSGIYTFDISDKMDLWNYSCAPGLSKNTDTGTQSCFYPNGYYHNAWQAMNDDSNFYVVRFFDNDDIIFGRAWVKVNSDDTLYVFNSYGLQLNKLTIIMSLALNTSVTQGDICDENFGLYLNSDRVNVLGDDVTYKMSVDIYTENGESGYTCYSCDDRISEDEMYYQDGEVYCQCCHDDHFSYCEGCNEYHMHEDMIYVESECQSYCEGCIQSDYTYCYSCDEYHANCDITSVGDDTYCDDCAAEIASPCSECGEWHKHENTVIVDDDIYCDSCHDDHFTYCDHCHEAINNDDIMHHDVESYCKDCHKEQIAPELNLVFAT